MKKVWYVYILECSDGTLYTGITNDLKKRIKAHNEGKGAKYTKGRSPVVLKYCFMWPSKSEALKNELKIKKKTKEKKFDLINHSLNNRIRLVEVFDILEEQGWRTEGEVDSSNPNNNSTYIIWTKDKKILYLGNYFIESEEHSGFPWKDLGVKKENILALLKGDINLAENY